MASKPYIVTVRVSKTMMVCAPNTTTAEDDAFLRVLDELPDGYELYDIESEEYEEEYYE